MLLNLSDEHLQQLAFLHNSTDDIVKEFVDISHQFLSGGINPKVFRVAAQKLEVEQNVVEDVVFGLMQTFCEATKHRLSSDDLFDSFVALDFRESVAKIVKEAFASGKETQRALNNCVPTLPAYDNVEWRLDIKLASRSLHQQTTPVILMKLHTSDGDTKSVKALETDPVNLLHMTKVVEEALDEMKSSHVRRILRNIS